MTKCSNGNKSNCNCASAYYNEICPYDSTVSCNSEYQFNEFYRQIPAAYERGESVSFVSNKPCMARPNECPRYTVAQKVR